MSYHSLYTTLSLERNQYPVPSAFPPNSLSLNQSALEKFLVRSFGLLKKDFILCICMCMYISIYVYIYMQNVYVCICKILDYLDVLFHKNNDLEFREHFFQFLLEIHYIVELEIQQLIKMFYQYLFCLYVCLESVHAWPM